MRSLLRLGDGDDSMQIATSNNYPMLDMCILMVLNLNSRKRNGNQRCGFRTF